MESRTPLLAFLAQELAPREGRGLAVARIAAGCTITVAIAMTFRIPLAAYMVYMVFLTSNDDIAGTARMAVAGTLAITLSGGRSRCSDHADQSALRFCGVGRGRTGR
jgi:hypothetical protein